MKLTPGKRMRLPEFLSKNEWVKMWNNRRLTWHDESEVRLTPDRVDWFTRDDWQDIDEETKPVEHRKECPYNVRLCEFREVLTPEKGEAIRKDEREKWAAFFDDEARNCLSAYDREIREGGLVSALRLKYEANMLQDMAKNLREDIRG